MRNGMPVWQVLLINLYLMFGFQTRWEENSGERKSSVAILIEDGLCNPVGGALSSASSTLVHRFCLEKLQPLTYPQSSLLLPSFFHTERNREQESFCASLPVAVVGIVPAYGASTHMTPWLSPPNKGESIYG
jgi:hypothetical protein